MFVASSRDVAGWIMHSEDSVGDAIVGSLSEELRYEYSNVSRISDRR